MRLQIVVVVTFAVYLVLSACFAGLVIGMGPLAQR